VTRAEGPDVFEFGGFRLEPQRRLLSRVDGEPIAVTDKAFDALVYLVERAGQLVTKDELLKALWPATVVEENNLYVAISTLRRALKDESAAQRLIVTVAGRGYQFVADVRAIGAAPENPVLQQPAIASPAAIATAETVSTSLPPMPKRRLILITGAVLAFAIVIVATLVALRPARAPASVTLAVLPFKPLTPDDRNESLELGMAETLIAGLNSGKLSVSPLSSVRRYAGSEQDGLAAGRALGVQSVLEGHIQRVGGQLRVSARLLNVSDGRQLWAQRFDEAFTDIFTVQDTIAARVRAALATELTGEESPALRRYTEDSEAYQLYANGRFHLQRLNESGLRQALASFEQAVERDPKFALAHVGVAEAHSILGVFGVVAPNDAFPQARRAVDKALEIAPELGEAYASLGHIKVQFEHDWTGAERAYRRAIELNPGYARAQQWLGLLLALQGRFDEGIAQLRRAQALEPAHPGHSALIGMVLIYQRRCDQAIEQLQLTLEMDPDFSTTNTYLAAAYLCRGEYDRALEHLARVKSFAPGSAGYLGQIYALSGRRAEAVEEIDRLLALSKQRYVPAYDIATIYAALGETDKTFDWLARAFEERSQILGWLPWDPVFDGIRKDARYAPLAKRLP
jgi:DNA-binding winged helix-turn-helix (wHTH) protein/TolB-like protein/cytochrome c-type biogenesis protein CcmH/NrfG